MTSMRQDRPFPNDLAQYDEFVIQGLISPEEMRRVDCNAQALGISGLELMESAGTGLSMVARKYQKDRILILCGSGNNGGDGMVAARHLSGEADVMVLWYNSGRQTEGTKTHFTVLQDAKSAQFHSDAGMISTITKRSSRTQTLSSTPFLEPGEQALPGNHYRPALNLQITPLHQSSLQTCLRLASVRTRSVHFTGQKPMKQSPAV